MVTFVQIAEYILELAGDAIMDDKEEFYLRKADFQAYLLIDHGIIDSRTVNNYWKNLAVLDCHINKNNISNNMVFRPKPLVRVCEEIISKQKRQKK